MALNRTLATLLTLASIVTTAPALAAQYTFTDLGSLGGPSQAIGINASNQITETSLIESTRLNLSENSSPIIT